MGKAPHPPRGGGPSKKKAAPDFGEDTSFIVFGNDKPDKKKARNPATNDDPAASSSNAKAQAPAEDAPKKPDTRTLIGGASWTGKLPVTLLSEHCQRQAGWDKPEYTMSKTPDGFSSMVILKKKSPKTQEVSALPPFKLPPTHKHLAMKESALEARHFAATYALFRISSMKNIHMMLPPAYRDLWKGEFQTLKKEDEHEGKIWMYDADPFQAAKDRDDSRAKRDAEREARDKAAKAKADAPGGSTPGAGLGGKDLSIGWKSAAKVELGKRTRREVEDIIKSNAAWNPNDVVIPPDVRARLINEVAALGFRRSHAEEAAAVCRDRDEMLEWLLIHVPEDDLPGWSLPEGYVAGISMASGNLKREAAVKRLALGGYAPELCEEAYEAEGGDEAKAAEKLQNSLLGDDASSDGSQTESEAWEEEQEVLVSIYSGKLQRVTPDVSRIALDVAGLNQAVAVQFRRPGKRYPQTVPVLTVDAQIPAYIRLSITRKALEHAKENFLGEQMMFNIVDWLEREIPEILERPGRLVDVASVSSQAAAQQSNGAQPRRKRGHPPVKPLNQTPDTPQSRKILAEFEARQATPAQEQMNKGRRSLPAWSLQEALVAAVQTHQVVIVSGETGSGKSTQSVQFILDDLIRSRRGGAANIVCTQPRRISALGLADRVAQERCGRVGGEVGYAIRGESRRGPDTRITFVTTGVLLRRLQTAGGAADAVVAALADVSHVVVDEVHERSLDTDFLLALLRDVLARRRDLRVVLMSATLDAAVFENYFGGRGTVGRVEIQGRTFPVEDFYLDDVVRMTGAGQGGAEEAEEENLGRELRRVGMRINYDLIRSLVAQIDADMGAQVGGILIFLPGTVEISRTLDALRGLANIHALPLHASLLPAEQRRVFPPAPAGKRKVIAATNVAETSITIEDIVAVVDSGRVKETRFDPENNMVKLEEVWASRAACKQRRGRAGRVRAGKCYKLYTRNAEAKMAERPEPEIRRVPLEQLCLSVKAMGEADVAGFLGRTLTPPATPAVAGALRLLQRMGAIDGAALTALGRHMAMIPTDLRCAKLMVYGALFGCLEASVTVAAVLTVRSPFVAPQDKREAAKAARAAFAVGHGDVVADLRACEAYAEVRGASSYRDVRAWCEANFLSAQTLADVATTRAQYLVVLQEIGFLPYTYRSPPPGPAAYSFPLLNALVLSALHPQTLRIALPSQKYAATMSGTMALDPESREIKFFDAENKRAFIHPSSTLFAAQAFPNNAGFLSYFNKVETSRVFVRELSPCSAFGVLMFGGPIELDTRGRGLVVDGWIRLRGWARIGVLVSRLRGVLDDVLGRWVEEPGAGKDGELEARVIGVVRKLIELDGMDR